ncbi:WS/DGAT/MGAT family acyltransferase [Streptosporangium becharense]|uniref:Diacylglycerol O-acyltransferase n=1 Tax=Streptosporangium becharense TaxID=1816182 RepID=A0A7W9IKV5_9ACTN|nr:wax ester/triacylglycerol synthase family O-acyltransferase [Streptosporangium becharense]MBB2911578.1 WS/DGAT/MGAT family acyltransferase [Streptosporangium becharense]MBB5822604.1 WS/DGAT/MGAT family acyltransferase [Streptosporangium becharense]
MRQLTALDTQFLHVETPTAATHVGGLALLDPTCAPTGTVTRKALIDLLRRRLHLAPALRLRLADVPFSLDNPYWEEDSDFDVADHVHELTLSAPGDSAQLAELVAYLHEQHLDRSRPLWEMYLIHGLAGGRTAFYTKIHHCAIDGVSGAQALAALLDIVPEPDVVQPTEPSGQDRQAPAFDPITTLARAVTRSVSHPVRALGSLTKAAADLDAIPLAATVPGARLVSRTTRTLAGLISGDTTPLPELPSLAAPRTLLDGPVSGERSFSYGSLPFDEIRSMAKSFGVSVNDVVMTLCASALRSWLCERDALPDRPLIAAIPVAVRRPGVTDTIGNQISAMIAPIPTNMACPTQRLHTMGQTMRLVKRRFELSPATWLSDVSALMPAPVAALALPRALRLAPQVNPVVNVIISNVPGPRFPLYLCGARVLNYHPVSMITDATGGINITCFSYDGSLDFGLIACPDRVDDVWGLLDHLHLAMEELRELANLNTAE